MMKKHFAKILCIALLGLAIIPGTKSNAATGTVINKDFNYDGVVDSTDYNLLSAHYNSKPTSSNWDARYDLNNDGIVDIYDIVKVSVAEGTKTTVSVPEVNTAILNYWNLQMNTRKTGQPANYSSVIKDSNFNQYNLLKDASDYKWYSQTSDKVSSFTNELASCKIVLDSDTRAVARVVKHSTIQYNSSSDTTDDISENHVVVLDKVNGKWYIEKDIYNLNNDQDKVTSNETNIENVNKTSYVTDQIQAIKDSSSDITALIANYKKAQTTQSTTLTKSSLSSATTGPSRLLAVAYAGANYEYGNSRYKAYSSDCQNFVSQCLLEAGFQSGSVEGVSWKPDGDAFISVLNFAAFAKTNYHANQAPNSPKAVETVLTRSQLDQLANYAEYGDVVQFHTRGWDYTHSVIIIGYKLGDYKLWYAGHTSNRVNSVYNTMYESLTNMVKYDYIRVLHITNYTR